VVVTVKVASVESRRNPRTVNGGEGIVIADYKRDMRQEKPFL